MKRELRVKLQELSLKLFGSKNRWQGLYNSGAFDVPAGEERKVLRQAYVRAPNGQLLTDRKALALELITADQYYANKDEGSGGLNVQMIPVLRRPSPEELVGVMEGLLNKRTENVESKEIVG